MDKTKLVGDIVENGFKHGEGRKTVVFASSVAHSVHLRDAFLDAEPDTLTAAPPKDERDAALAASMHDSDEFCTRRSARTEAIRPVGIGMTVSSCNALVVDLPLGGLGGHSAPAGYGPDGIKPRAMCRNSACSGQLVGR